MRKFQIIPIAHSLKNNKVAKTGDVVSESQLTSPASELIEAGFIKEVFEAEDIEAKEAEEVIPLIAAENEEESEEGLDDVKKEIKDIKKPKVKK